VTPHTIVGDRQWPSPNFGDRRCGVRPSMIVLHYTAMENGAVARARLCDPTAEVSAHWLISEGGAVEALVDEAKRAWHAGAGAWAGVTDVNSHSIGIELVNRGTHPFPEPQMTALEGLLCGIMQRWNIAAHRVIGHSDMAPGRKADPGARFDWQRLARAGLSVWPVPQGRARSCDFAKNARRFGYPDAGDDLILAAFRLRFRPWATGPADAVDAAMAVDLAARWGEADLCR
jgi:N-acetylmuramoyl-L-alanine amidase